jgi:hypothetical protein
MSNVQLTTDGIQFGDGTTLTSNSAVAAAATGVPTLNIYTSSGSYTKPATVKAIKVTVIGGGGAGGSNPNVSFGQPSAAFSGAGGGAGGVAIRNYPAPSLPASAVPYTVGGAGGTSSFGVAPLTVVSATGGSTGGSFGYCSGGGAGGTGSNGNLNITGGIGTNGYVAANPTSSHGMGGTGGSNGFGSGGSGATGSPSGGGAWATNGSPGVVYGGGGGGSAGWCQPGYAASPSTATGGSGSAGAVIIEEFY